MDTGLSVRTIGLLCVVVILSGCGKTTTAPSSSGSNSGSSGRSSNPPTTVPAITDADLTFCLSETNRYRSMRSRSALTRSTALEVYAADSARIDARAQTPHQHFTSGNGGGVSLAENEVLNAATSNALTTQSAIQGAITLFYSEGPGGGHFENMMGYGSLGCGVYRTSTTITVVQDFR